MPAQLAGLLALTADRFDIVPSDQMTQTVIAVTVAVTKIPVVVSARFETAKALSDEDRPTMIELARKALAVFKSDA